MILGNYRFNYLPGLLAGTATVAAIVISQPAMAKSAKEVAQVAVPTTVQINNVLSADKSGSGVIIAKNGNTYTVLTANHVVKNPNSEYMIRTSKGKDHPVKSVQSLQKNQGDPDLAIAKFESEEEYAIAPISDSDEASIGSGVYISGYPLPSEVGGATEREYAFTNGVVSNRSQSDPSGYTMRYDAVTRRGMSGGPVFDVSGRVIAIHGQGEREGSVAVETGSGTQIAEVKTGFNRAVPINTFVAMSSQVGMDRSAFKVDDSAPENVDAEEVKQSDVNNWFNNFAAGLAERVIDRVVPRIRLPF